jgi:phosphatidylglycerophosphate synthase
VSPNVVSLASIVFALVGAAVLITGCFGPIASPLVMSACIQLRLLANMLDGMIAVEGGRQTSTSELYNEIPDRIADVLFLVATGYACHQSQWGVGLGWCAAVLAVSTAYIRALGARRGHPQDFCGPQAKPHRMFLLTVANILASVESSLAMRPRTLFVFLILITLGTAVTCVRRTVHLAKVLKKT